MDNNINEGNIKKGEKYNLLTADRYSHTKTKVRIKKGKPCNDYTRYWVFKCDCGKEKTIDLLCVKEGKSKSCGCISIEKARELCKAKRLGNGEAAANATLLTYIRNAKKRNIEFNLTKEEFLWFTKQDCNYCGDGPSNVYKSTSGSGDYIYNGIDRVNPKLNYTFDNCVPCCKTCNVSKTDKSLEEYNEWLIRLINNNKHLINLNDL